MRRTGSPFVLVLLVACGGGGAATVDSPPLDGSAEQGNTCNVTLTGDVNGSGGCTPAATEQDNHTQGSLVFGISPLPPGVGEFTVSYQIAGAPTVMSYTAADLESGGITILTSGGIPNTYSEAVGSNPRGSIESFEITTADAGADSGGSTVYKIHGSLAATCPEVGGTGTVHVTTTF